MKKNTLPLAASDSFDPISTPSTPIDSCSNEMQRSLTRRRFIGSTGIASSGVLLSAVPYHATTSASENRTIARGSVFTNLEGQGSSTSERRGLPDMLVSNGRSIAQTDEKGNWELELDDSDDTIFVIKPRNWIPRLDSNNLPQHSYLHLPDGSPKLKYGGIAPTGRLPDSIDFELKQHPEPESFHALLCGDPQPRDLREIDYLSRTVVPHLQNTQAAFGISLGDIMFDDLSLFGPLNQAYRLIGIPWFNALGNHDLDYDAPSNDRAHDSFKQCYGASYYSFDWGPAHFLILDNLEWIPANPNDPKSKGEYRGIFGQKQLEFVKNDLARVARDRLIVVGMHIPLKPPTHREELAPASHTADADELLRLLSPFANTISFSAHYHVHGHIFLDQQFGWEGPGAHHHIITGTQCGSWFRGAPNASEIPHATMSDGTPPGYVDLEIDGNRANINGYRAFGKTANFQMRIDVPNGLPAEEIQGQAFYANIFNGSERSRVRYRIEGLQNDWNPLEKTIEFDPAYVRLHERDKGLERPFYPLPNPYLCTHLWKGTLPETIAPGTYRIEVVETDLFGNIHQGWGIFRVS